MGISNMPLGRAAIMVGVDIASRAAHFLALTPLGLRMYQLH